MRFGAIFLIILTAFIMICSTALGESAESDSITYESWDWDNESVNAFSGSVDLSGWIDTEVTLELKASFEPDRESVSGTEPKFTHFNGSRLTMLEQRDNITCTPEAGQASISFAGSIQMPEKNHFQKITIELKAVDAEGKELKKISVNVSRGGISSSQTGNIIYIPFEIRTAAIIIAAAAAIVWCLAILRNRILNRK